MFTILLALAVIFLAVIAFTMAPELTLVAVVAAVVIGILIAIAPAVLLALALLYSAIESMDAEEAFQIGVLALVALVVILVRNYGRARDKAERRSAGGQAGDRGSRMPSAQGDDDRAEQLRREQAQREYEASLTPDELERELDRYEQERIERQAAAHEAAKRRWSLWRA